jgi:1-acyl-sn-glycerol-3-phosphate acyltransferase
MDGKITDSQSGCLALNGQPASPILRVWLAVGVMLGYLEFAMGCLALLVFSVWLSWCEERPERRTLRLRRGVSRMCRWYLKFNSALGLIRFEYRHLRPLGPGMIVANHPSLIDALLIIAEQPHVCCVLKGDLQRMQVFGQLIRQLDYVSNANPEQLLAEGSERLAGGETLLVFPEATRTKPGDMPTFRLGAAEMLIRSGATAYPIVLHKADSYLSKSRAWYRFPSRPMMWIVDIDDAMHVTTSDQPREDRRRITGELQTYFRQRLVAGCTGPAMSGKSSHEHIAAVARSPGNGV